MTPPVDRQDLTVGELEILQHSLGIDPWDSKKRKPYRNYFIAGGRDLHICQRLVAKGLMVQRNATDLTGGDPCFNVTEDGVKIAVQR